MQKLLKASYVIEICGISTATLYRWMAEGVFPKPIRVGANSVRWTEKSVTDWMNSKQA